MTRPVEQDGARALRQLAADVERQKMHLHPGMVTDPETITGPRSDTAAVMGQLLDALSAAGIIIDETTG